MGRATNATRKGKGGAMKKLARRIVGVSLGLCVALGSSGPAAAEDDVVTITGQVVVEEQDAAGDVIISIVTETDTYVIHEDSKASDLNAHGGKNVTAKGKVQVTEMSRTIWVDEYALVEADRPPVGAP
jgi:hypothetical protein